MKNGLSDWVRPKKECSICKTMQAIIWDWRKRKLFSRCCHGFLYIGFKIICLWPKKLSPVWYEDSCCSNVTQDFEWGLGQNFSTFWFWESFVPVKTHKPSCPRVKLQYIHWKSALCTAAVCENLHLGLANVPSLWLGDIPLFLIASEGMTRKRRVLELVPLAVWEENYSEEMQLSPTK